MSILELQNYLKYIKLETSDGNPRDIPTFENCQKM